MLYRSPLGSPSSPIQPRALTQAALFLDGSYLDRCGRDAGNPRIDYAALADALVGGADLFRAYYYHCLPWVGHDATSEDQDRAAAKSRFFGALRRLPRFEVKEGRLDRRGVLPDGRPAFVQMQVATAMAVDITRLALRSRVHQVTVMSNDEDLVPALVAARNEGIIVRVVQTERYVERSLLDAADDQVVVPGAYLTRFPLPDPHEGGSVASRAAWRS